MRQRRPKDLEQRIDELQDCIITNPQDYKNSWEDVFGRKADTYLEIGSGKGDFLNTLAELNPDKNYIGFEGMKSIILRAGEKLSANGSMNLVFCLGYVNDMNEYFKKKTISGIYLNFSDPWPKDRHEKRRLTSLKFLKGYADVLKPGGFLRMKTDNDDFFEYSVGMLEEYPAFETTKITGDLHDSEHANDNVLTEYEKRFINWNKTINFIEAIRI